jgi:hypothetical protein
LVEPTSARKVAICKKPCSLKMAISHVSEQERISSQALYVPLLLSQ